MKDEVGMEDTERFVNYISDYLLIDDNKVVIKDAIWSKEGYDVKAEIEVFVPHKR